MTYLRSWVEIDRAQWRKNFAIIKAATPPSVGITAVVKDNAYGHGAYLGAKFALEVGASMIAVVNLEEALQLHQVNIEAPILLLGQTLESDWLHCLQNNITICLHDPVVAAAYGKMASNLRIKARIHVEIDTGMSRYGVRWTDAADLLQKIATQPFLDLEGVMSHFAMSDETDKSYADLQRARFQEALDAAAARGICPRIRHICNSGGFLDLPDAHYDMVRMGILPLGVYPSQVCRRIPGIAPVMTVKSRIMHIQNLVAGDKVGYGMRYTAPDSRRIAVLPIGYGDGFPRVRNEGAVLIGGHRAPLVGGVSMDAITVDITDIPQAKLWDEAVIMGRQGNEEISVHEVAALKKSVSYDVLTGWRDRLRRVYL